MKPVMSWRQEHNWARLPLRVALRSHTSLLPWIELTSQGLSLMAVLWAGLKSLRLPRDFHFIGPKACENCKRLVEVDLMRTDITAIWGSTFAYLERADAYIRRCPQPLSDPMHEELWEDNSNQLIIQKSFRVVSSKEQIRREAYDDHPRAIWVPANETDILPAKAFFALAGLRHVQVEAGYHAIERQAWRYCHTLTIVKLPSSVVTVANAVFQGSGHTASK